MDLAVIKKIITKKMLSHIHAHT